MAGKAQLQKPEIFVSLQFADKYLLQKNIYF